MRRIIGKIINFVFDCLAFIIAIGILVNWRAQRQANKIRNYLIR